MQKRRKRRKTEGGRGGNDGHVCVCVCVYVGGLWFDRCFLLLCPSLGLPLRVWVVVVVVGEVVVLAVVGGGCGLCVCVCRRPWGQQQLRQKKQRNGLYVYV